MQVTDAPLRSHLDSLMTDLTSTVLRLVGRGLRLVRSIRSIGPSSSPRGVVVHPEDGEPVADPQWVPCPKQSLLRNGGLVKLCETVQLRCV